jgi:hypothetical protein
LRGKRISGRHPEGIPPSPFWDERHFTTIEELRYRYSRATISASLSHISGMRRQPQPGTKGRRSFTRETFRRGTLERIAQPCRPPLGEVFCHTRAREVPRPDGREVEPPRPAAAVASRSKPDVERLTSSNHGARSFTRETHPTAVLTGQSERFGRSCRALTRSVPSGHARRGGLGSRKLGPFPWTLRAAFGVARRVQNLSNTMVLFNTTLKYVSFDREPTREGRGRCLSDPRLLGQAGKDCGPLRSTGIVPRR